MLHISSLKYAVSRESAAFIHLSNLLSPSPSPLPLASRYSPNSGLNSASRRKRLDLDLVVLPAILRIRLDQGLDPAASVGVRVGFEVVDLTTAV